MFQRVYSPRAIFAGMSANSISSSRSVLVARERANTPPRVSSPRIAESKDVVFRRLFDEQWARVRHHLEMFVDDKDEVDDLAAEVFVIAWRKLDPTRPLAPAWFLRTAHNKLRDRSRRNRSRERAFEALTRGLEVPAEPLDPMEVLALRAAVQSLNARERQVVVLTYWDGLSAGEISEVLRTSQAAVWTTLTRARGKLRRRLEGGES